MTAAGHVPVVVELVGLGVDGPALRWRTARRPLGPDHPDRAARALAGQPAADGATVRHLAYLAEGRDPHVSACVRQRPRDWAVLSRQARAVHVHADGETADLSSTG